MMAVEFDEQDRKDAEALLQALVWEVRESVASDVRRRFRYDHPEPPDEEIQGRVDDAVESELDKCGKKLARLLMRGID